QHAEGAGFLVLGLRARGNLVVHVFEDADLLVHPRLPGRARHLRWRDIARGKGPIQPAARITSSAVARTSMDRNRRPRISGFPCRDPWSSRPSRSTWLVASPR